MYFTFTLLSFWIYCLNASVQIPKIWVWLQMKIYVFHPNKNKKHGISPIFLRQYTFYFRGSQDSDWNQPRHSGGVMNGILIFLRLEKTNYWFEWTVIISWNLSFFLGHDNQNVINAYKYAPPPSFQQKESFKYSSACLFYSHFLCQQLVWIFSSVLISWCWLEHVDCIQATCKAFLWPWTWLTLFLFVSEFFLPLSTVELQFFKKLKVKSKT